MKYQTSDSKEGESNRLADLVANDLQINIDIWTVAWLGESVTLHSYFSLKSKPEIRNHPDGQNPDIRNQGGWTPLLYACHVGHVNIISILLQVGADPNLSSPTGLSPLGLVSSSGNFDCINLLVKYGANIKAINKYKNTVLHLAAINGHQQTIEILLKSGAISNIDIQNSDGNTPLIEAVLHGHERAVMILSQAGSNIMIRNNQNHTALDIATIQKLTRIRENLLGHFNGKYSVNIKPPGKFNLDESVPSIHTGPQAFKNMINNPNKQNNDKQQNDYQIEMLRRMEELRIKSTKKSLPKIKENHPTSKMIKEQTADQSLHAVLERIGMTKWEDKFVTEDIDLHVFLTLDDEDLKKIGIKLFGPRRKMTTQICRIMEEMEPILPTSENAFADRIKLENEKLKIELNNKNQFINELQQNIKQEKQLRTVAENSWNDEQQLNLQYQQIIGSLLNSLNDLSIATQSITEKENYINLKRSIESRLRQNFCI